MRPYYADPLVTLYLGDCLEVMAAMEADSVDAVVTDPPYGLEFMGKGWDKFGRNTGNGYQEKPRMNDGAGLGGYQTRPNFYTAGSPFQAWCTEWGTEALRVTKPGGYLLAFGGTRTHHRLVCGLEDAGWIIRDELDWIYASGFPKGRANLKPAHEPIVLARKPGPLRPLAIDECRIPSSMADREVIAKMGGFGKAGYQRKRTDETFMQGTPEATEADANPSGRWPSNVLLSDPELFDEPNPEVVGSGATPHSQDPATRANKRHGSYFGGVEEFDNPGGYGDSGGYSRFFIIPKSDRAERERGLAAFEQVKQNAVGPATVTAKDWDDPDAKRYERNSVRANHHPTVKPIDLMRHLVRLVTPPGGVCLDPFLGSGTTALAASEEGFRCIGIEREPDYLEIAKGRLLATPMGLGLDVGAPVRKRPHAGRGPNDTRPTTATNGTAPKGWTGGWSTDDEEPAA